MVAVLARYASRFSVRALDLKVDSSMLWVGVALAIAAAVLLAFVPRLPSGDSSNGLALSSGGLRVTGSATRRQRVFAMTQIGASFVLLAGASMLMATLLSLQAAQTGFDMRRVLALNVPVMSYGQDAGSGHGILQGSDAADRGTCRAWIALRWVPRCRGAMRGTSVQDSSFPRTAT